MTQTAAAAATADAHDWAIDLKNVQKVYKGKVHALQGIDMRVRRGEVFGLLGPNGAGKSTLVKIMMTVIRPTRAEGTILGHPVGRSWRMTWTLRAATSWDRSTRWASSTRTSSLSAAASP